MSIEKVRYRDRIAALVALSAAQRTDGSGRPKTERRAYQCTGCGAWHLTSQGRPPRFRTAAVDPPAIGAG